MGGIRPWTLLVSVAVHLALLLFLLDRQDDAGASAVGLGGLEVALGPAGGATTSPVAPDAPPVEDVRSTAPVETVARVEEVEAEPPVPEEPPPPEVPTPPQEVPPPETPLPEPVQAARPVEMAQVAEPDTPPLITSSTVDPVEALATAPPEVEARPVAEPRPAGPEAVRPKSVPEAVRPEPVPETVRPEPVPEPVRPETVQARDPVVTPLPPRPRRDPPQRRTPTRTAEAAQPAPAPAPAAEPGPAGPAATASADPGPPASTRGTPGAAQGADADSDPGGGLPGPTPDYLGLLRAWLEKHKEYPRPSRTRREEGTVLLRFVMERSGRIVSHRIERSSGYPELDRAVEEMLARAEPLPAMPAEMTQARLELVVPVQFALRGR